MSGINPPYELRHLTVFVAVAEELNFHRAASRLGMAQPAVSRLVADLESRLGARLFERTTRSVSLTEPGRYLLDEARETLSRVEMSARTAQSLAHGSRGHLKVAYMTFAGHTLTPRIVKRFGEQFPEVVVELVYLGTEAQREAILHGEIDVAFMIGPFQASDIRTETVAYNRLVAILPATHTLTNKSILRPTDVVSEPIVMGSQPDWSVFRRIVVDAFQSAGCVPEIHTQATSLTGLLGLVTAGIGITFFAGFPAYLDTKVLVARPIEVPEHAYVPTVLAWRQGDTRPSLKAFVDVAIAEAGVKAARAARKPTIRLQAELRQDLTGGRGRSSSVGITAGVDLNSSSFRGREVTAAEQSLRAAQQLRTAVERDLQNEMRNYRQRLQALAQTRQSLGAQVSDARVVLEAYEGQFRAGQRDLIDLLTTGRDLYETQMEQIDVEDELNRKEYEAAEALGLLGSLLFRKRE